MNTDRLNRWMTLGANLGVLVGIILLIVELTQNREMMRAQIRNDIAAHEVQRMDILVADAELAEILVRVQNGEDLSPSEEIRARFRRYGSFRSWENVYYQYQLGLFDQSEYVGQRASWTFIIKNRNGYKDYWCDFRLQTSKEFRVELESLIEGLSCE